MVAERKKYRRRKLLLLIEIILILIAAYIGIMFLIYSKLQNDNFRNSDVYTNDLNDPNISKYTNIALFGVDSRKNDLKKNTRSDSIIIASINKMSHKVRLVSIYRDTLVFIPDHGYTKITHAYAYGGPRLAIETINRNFDMNITDYITVNFSALTDLVDALGGIKVKITKDELDYVNKYAKDVANINKKEWSPIKAGENVLSGVFATGYSRVRYTAGGDFTRTERQRTIINAIMDKAKHSNPVKLYKAADTTLPQVYTSLNAVEFVKLASFFPLYSMKDQTGFPFENANKRVNNAAVVVPETLSSNVTELHKFLFGTKKYKTSDTVNAINSEMSVYY